MTTPPTGRAPAGLPATARRNGRWFAGLTLASALAAAGFAHFFPTVTDDGRLYLELAHSLLRTGHYARWMDGHWIASSARMPGYPLLLAAILRLAAWSPGAGHWAPIFTAQWLFQLGTAGCAAGLAWLIAPPNASQRARRTAVIAAFGLTALCPFLSMFTAAVLTEMPAVFCTTAAIVCALLALRSLEQRHEAANQERPRPAVRPAPSGPRAERPGPLPRGLNPAFHPWLGWWALCGLALAAGILIRPDTGLALIVLSLPLLARVVRRPQRRPALIALVLLYAIALAPVAIWTARNWTVLHVFRPLVTVDATEVGELEYPGFDRWTKTWLAGYRGVEDFLDNAPGEPLDPAALPPWALGHGPERAQTLALIAAYNRSDDFTAALDAQFARLAAERIRRHPARYYLALPAARMASLWLSPRIEFLPVDDHWWPPAGPWENDARDFLVTCAYLGLNLVLLGLGVVGLGTAKPRYAWWLGGLIVARTVLLSAYPSCEPRYTLELYPVVLAWGAWALAALHDRTQAALSRPS